MIGGASVVIPTALTGVTRPLTLNGSGVAGNGALQALASGTWTGAIILDTPDLDLRRPDVHAEHRAV